jgi:alpha-ribazole phosphatase
LTPQTRKTDPEAPTRLFLVRHGEVEGDGVLHGHVDVPLTAKGVAQLQAVAERLSQEPIAALYSSDLQRARTGAELIGRGRAIPLRVEAAFRELHMGAWDGRSFEELMERDGEGLKTWWRELESFVLPGGESLGQLRDRVLPALKDVLDRHEGETVCLVAHGGVNRVILFDLLGIPLAHYHKIAQDYGCVNLVEYHPDSRIVVRRING